MELYIGIFNDNTEIRRETLEEIQNVPYLKYIFKGKSHSTFEDNGYVRTLYKYTLINSKGESLPLIAGNFEIIDIEPDQRFNARKVLISENKGEKIHIRYFNHYRNAKFIVEELIPLLETLIITGSMDIYLKLQEIPILKDQISKLEMLLENRNDEIDTLQKEIENLKANSKN